MVRPDCEIASARRGSLRSRARPTGGSYTMVFINKIKTEQMIQIETVQVIAALGLASIFGKMWAVVGFVEARGGRYALAMKLGQVLGCSVFRRAQSLHYQSPLRFQAISKGQETRMGQFREADREPIVRRRPGRADAFGTFSYYAIHRRAQGPLGSDLLDDEGVCFREI
jgi:hypothetical protein